MNYKSNDMANYDWMC